MKEAALRLEEKPNCRARLPVFGRPQVSCRSDGIYSSLQMDRVQIGCSSMYDYSLALYSMRLQTAIMREVRSSIRVRVTPNQIERDINEQKTIDNRKLSQQVSS